MIIIQLSGKLAGIFSSGTILLVGSIVLLKSMSLNYDTVIKACKFGIGAAVIAGILGYYIGKTFEKSNFVGGTHEPKSNSELLIDDILNDEIVGLDDDIEQI